MNMPGITANPVTTGGRWQAAWNKESKRLTNKDPNWNSRVLQKRVATRTRHGGSGRPQLIKQEIYQSDSEIEELDDEVEEELDEELDELLEEMDVGS
jgi:hypothetical protein